MPTKVYRPHLPECARIVQIAAGAHLSYALSSEGHLWAWGKYVYDSSSLLTFTRGNYVPELNMKEHTVYKITVGLFGLMAACGELPEDIYVDSKHYVQREEVSFLSVVDFCLNGL